MGASTRSTGLVYTQKYKKVFLKKTKAPAGASTRNAGLLYTQKDKKEFVKKTKKLLRERPPITQDLYTLKHIRWCVLKQKLAGASTHNTGRVCAQKV